MQQANEVHAQNSTKNGILMKHSLMRYCKVVLNDKVLENLTFTSRLKKFIDRENATNCRHVDTEMIYLKYQINEPN